MLDTRARKYVEPLIESVAHRLIHIGLTANQVTVAALVIGCSTSLFIYFEQPFLAIIALWLSGLLDAVDGTMARHTRSSAWGTVLDVTFDRVVEISMILALAFRYPNVMWALLVLSGAILFSMTIFLTVGAVAEKQGIKSFYYQAGLAERTEGFVLFSLMIVYSNQLLVFTLLFAVMVIFTGCQRLVEAKRILE